MTTQITPEEIERVSAALAAVDATARHDAVDVKLIGTFMEMSRDIVEKLRNAALAALDHPAALERAREEERGRCLKIVADRIMAARVGELDADLRSIANSIDYDIRALGSAQTPPAEDPPMTDQTITLEEIERWRTAFAEMLADGRDDAPGDFARLLAAAEVALDHPVALERARAEERERCAQYFVEKAKRLGRGAAWQKARIKGGPEVYHRHSDDDLGDDWRPDNGPAIAMRGAMADAAAIRALGPAPSPSAEDPAHG